MIGFPDTLAGAKTRLRPFTAKDITAQYLGWLNDPIAMRFSNQRFRRHTAETSATYLAGFSGSANLFLAVDSESGRRLGTMTAYRAPRHGTADMGILIGERAAWGQGVGLDAWVTLLAWLLGPAGLRKVTAGTLDCNEPMLAIARKSGMHLEGSRKRQEIVDGIEHDILYFARFAAA